MIDRLDPQIEPTEPENKFEFTTDNVKKLPLATKDELQRVYWDTDTTGLSVLCSQTTRTYRASYVISFDKDHANAGKSITKKSAR
jgi:hypothetical protein